MIAANVPSSHGSSLHFSPPSDGGAAHKGNDRNRPDESSEETPNGSHRERLRRTLAKEDLSSSAKIVFLLQIGADRLGVENAHVVRIDPAEGGHRIVETSGSHPAVEEGATADLSTTYCRKVVAEGGPYAVADAEAEGWAGDPAYEAYGLACYHGTKVIVGEELYGTVCFVDRDPRPEAVGEAEATFVELVAQAIGQVIEQRRREKAVQKEKKQLNRTQHLLRRVQRAAKVGGWELDAQAEESFWTEEMRLMLGLDEEDLELDEVLRRMEAENREQVQAAIERCLQEGEPFTVEAALESGGDRGPGSELVEMHGVPFGEAEGQEAAEKVVGAVRDITDRKQWRKKVEMTRRESLHRLARAAEKRDNETGEHLRRVGQMARLLAEALDKDPTWQERILEAAPLHDVGKIGIPDRILLKEGPLTDAEYELMKEHTTMGADLLSGDRSKLLRMTRQVTRHHHERWDGTGYPDGLEGEDAPLAARIVAVVDAFDAMTSDRPYRDPLPADVAFEEIEEEAGAQFDPQVSRAALDLRETLSPFAAGA